MAKEIIWVSGKKACPCMKEGIAGVEADLRAMGVIKKDLTGLITQGSYNNTVAESGNTHSGGGVWDVKWKLVNTDKKKAVWFKWGFIPFERGPLDGMVYHGHVVTVGCKHLDPSAARQVTSARKGKNALRIPKTFRGKMFPIISWDQAIKKATPTPGNVITVTANTLNVRNGPGTDFKAIKKLKKGESYEVADKSGSWGRLTSGKGTSNEGWIHLGYTTGGTLIPKIVKNDIKPVNPPNISAPNLNSGKPVTDTGAGNRDQYGIHRVIHKPPYKLIAVDGKLGAQSINRLQQQLNVALTGKLDHFTVRALRVWLRQTSLNANGQAVLDTTTIMALQGRVGSRKDGLWAPTATKHSPTTELLQAYLNKYRNG